MGLEIIVFDFAAYSFPEIADVLLGTHDAEIVEHTKSDSYWGDGGDGSGKNMLGKILMDVRERLKRER